MAAVREFESEIVAKRPVMDDAHLVELSAPPGLAAAMRPGQFVEVLCRVEGSYDPLLRRPYSLYATNPANDRFTLLIRPYGRGSEWLSQQRPGGTLDILGPLGNAFEIRPKSRHLLMVAGGVGAAPLVMLAERAVARGVAVTYLMGAMDASGLLPASALPAAVEYHVATEDGSQGHRGYVTELVADYIQWADQIYSCGPEPMFRSLRQVVRQHRVTREPRVWVSVERTMACGLGACLGCVVETRRGMRTSCVDGPVFEMDDLLW